MALCLGVTNYFSMEKKILIVHLGTRLCDPERGRHRSVKYA